MNKSELVHKLAITADLSDDEAFQYVDTFFSEIRKALIKGKRVEIRDFGSFKIKEYQGYKGRNPKTGESVTVKPKKLPFFRAGRELKEIINED